MSGPVVGDDGIARCPWGSGNEVLRNYHDDEWGRPVAGESALFERLSLEGAQAGLSWLTILNKREGYRRLFHAFDVDACSGMTDAHLDAAMLDPGIVRNRAKVESVRKNARATVDLRADGGLVGFVEGFVPEDTPRPARTGEMPTTSAESLALSKALKKSGFGFVGPTTMFAMMEAVGYVDTHLLGCHRRGVSGRFRD